MTEKMRRGKSTLLFTRLKDEEYQKLAALAKEQNLQLAAMLRGIIRQYLACPFNLDGMTRP